MDFDRIKTLLDVFHDTRDLPKLKAIHLAAQQELEAIAAGEVEEAEEPAETEAETPKPVHKGKRV